MAGYFKVFNLRVIRPSFSLQYEAELVYESTLQESLSMGVLSSEEIAITLSNYGLWDESRETRISEIPKEIEELKLKLYNERLKSETTRTTKIELENIRKEYSTLFSQRHSHDTYSAEGIANFAKLCFMVRSCTFHKEKLYKFTKESLEQVITEYQKNIIGEDTFRGIARQEPWQTIWNSIKVCPLKEPTDEQQKLIRISTFYDNLRESPDCPPEFVINDDDMLDGYLISHRRQREKDEVKQDIEGTMNKKISRCSEIYIPCETEEDAQKVFALNNAHSKAIQAARDKALMNSENGKVCEVDMPDIKKKLQMEMSRAGL